MGKICAELDERLTNFIARQPVFSGAIEPSVTADVGGGHVGVSPRGYSTGTRLPCLVPSRWPTWT